MGRTMQQPRKKNRERNELRNKQREQPPPGLNNKELTEWYQGRKKREKEAKAARKAAREEMEKKVEDEPNKEKVEESIEPNKEKVEESMNVDDKTVDDSTKSNSSEEKNVGGDAENELSHKSE